MPKIRSIHPDFWTDSSILSLTVVQRLFYIGLWNYCDDDGVFEWNELQLKVRILPNDKCDKVLDVLQKNGLIARLDCYDGKYGIVKNFSKYQKINKNWHKSILTEEERKAPNGGTTVDQRLAKPYNGIGTGNGTCTCTGTCNHTPTEYVSDNKLEVLSAHDHFLHWLNKQQIFPNKKTGTTSSRQKFVARRKKYARAELQQAFSNLTREPDLWKIKNNGHRPLSWWLHSDDRIEDMLACHLKKSTSKKNKAAIIISPPSQ